MKYKLTSLLALTALSTGLVLALAGCFFVDAGIDDTDDDGQFKVIDDVSAAAPLYITYVNRSDDGGLANVFVFAKNAIPGFDELADGVAWRVMPDIGKGSSSMFMVLPLCTVRASWGGVNWTQSLLAEAGQRYAVMEDDTGIVLIPTGSASQSTAIEVTCEVQVAGGITVELLNDGKVYLQNTISAYGQKATFITQPKLYWGLASEIQESQLIGAAVLNSFDFFEQDLTGVTGATVTLTGNAVSGYQFEVVND